MSPRYAFDHRDRSAVAGGRRVGLERVLPAVAATSPMLTQPEPDPEPLEIVGHDVPGVFPSGSPGVGVEQIQRVAGLRRASAPRLGIERLDVREIAGADDDGGGRSGSRRADRPPGPTR